MNNPQDYHEHGLALHGHKCPATPIGLRTGVAAMNKLGVKRVEVATGRALPDTREAEAMLPNKRTDFFKEYREKGVPTSEVPAEVVAPLGQKAMGAPAGRLLTSGELFEHEIKHRPHSEGRLALERDKG